MNNAVDFNKARKKRQRAHRLKQLLILTGVAVLVLLGVYLSELLVEQDVSTRLSDTIASFGGTGYPIDLPGGIIRDVGDVGGNLAILNDTNLYIYNKKAKPTSNIQQVTERTVMRSAKNRVLLYDTGGRKLQIYSPTKALYTHNLDDMVICADLGQSGGYVVVTSPKQYVAQVSAYDENYEWQFTWYSSEYVVSGAVLSPRGDMMAVACIDANGGVLESVINLFKLNAQEEIAEIRISDELVVGLDFPGDNRVTVITERGMHVYDASGKQTGHYELPQQPLIAFESNGRETLLICGERDHGTQTLVALNEQAKDKAVAEIDQKILDLAINMSDIFILTDTGITRYNHMIEKIYALPVTLVQRIALVSNRIYYLTQNEICLLEE